MARAAVRALRPRNGDLNRGAPDRPVTVKITNLDYDILTALSLIDQTGPADQIRSGLNYYFTLRMNDRDALQRDIDRARARQEATLAALTGDQPPQQYAQQPDGDDFVDKPAAPLDKPVTLRIGNDVFDILTAFSLVDEVSLADVLRAAIASYIDHRRNDPELISKLDGARENYATTMAVLSSRVG